MSAVVYFVQAHRSGAVKIGWSSNLDRRLATLCGASSELITVLATVSGGSSLEAHLHERFAADRLHGEWFRPSEALLGYVAQVVRHGTGCVPLGFTHDEAQKRKLGRHSRNSVADTARTSAFRARDALQARGYSRMEAYAIISQRIGTSVTWLRGLCGRHSDLAMNADVFLNLQEYADEIEARTGPEAVRRTVMATT